MTKSDTHVILVANVSETGIDILKREVRQPCSIADLGKQN